MTPRPYQIVTNHPAAMRHIAGIAALCVHAAQRCDRIPARTGCEALAHEHMRARADAIATVGLNREGIDA